jgi:hemoglobin
VIISPANAQDLLTAHAPDIINRRVVAARCFCAKPRFSHYIEETSMNKSLYERLGGYDGVTAVCNNLLPRLAGDPLLGRFWANRSDDGIAREKQLLIDFICNAAGGPMYYTGRDMKLSHKGMRISGKDWQAFMGHVNATLDHFQVPAAERADVIAFVESTRADIVEA